MRKTLPKHGLGYILFPETVIYLVIISKCIILNVLITEQKLLPYLNYFLRYTVAYGHFALRTGRFYASTNVTAQITCVPISFVTCISLPKNSRQCIFLKYKFCMLC